MLMKTGQIKSVVVKGRGNARGKRLIDLNSVRDPDWRASRCPERGM
jgi:hypothetical protein